MEQPETLEEWFQHVIYELPQYQTRHSQQSKHINFKQRCVFDHYTVLYIYTKYILK